MASNSQIIIRKSAVLVSDPRKTALGVSRPVILGTLSPGATIEIGAHSALSGATICAVHGVRIGERVLIDADILIADTDFHAVDVVPRRYEPVPSGSPADRVRIEDDVFIGARSIVLKGVTIGAGSVVGAGSLVTSDIPMNTVAAGVPAKVIRLLRSDRTHSQE